MNKELSTVLKNRLASLPFVDLLAGMVQTVSTQNSGADNEATAATLQRFPVSYDTPENCSEGVEVMLIPDTAKKSVIYFEDYGVTAGGDAQQFSSRIRVICWLNRARLVGSSYAEVGGPAMAEMIKRLEIRNPINVGIFFRLTTSIANIPPQDAALFSKYSYDETVRQYLRPPFEFFGIDIIAKYNVRANCLNEIAWTTDGCF